MSVPEKRDVLLHGHRVVYRALGRPGDGRPVIVLIHGMAGESATWREVLSEIGDDYVVIAPDLLGHGESDKPRDDYSLGAQANMLRDLMIALGIDKATVVGHSLGGGIAMQLAYQHPDRCERLVLVSSGGLGPEVSWMLRALAIPGAEVLMPVLFPSFVRTAGNAISRGLRRVGIRAPHIEQEWRSYVSLTDPSNRRSFLRTLRAVVDPGGQAVSAHDRLYLASQLPTLVVWGRRDRNIPVAHADAAHAAIPGSRLVIFDGAGHFPHCEDAPRFVETLMSFMKTTEPMALDVLEWRAQLTAGPPAAESS